MSLTNLCEPNCIILWLPTYLYFGIDSIWFVVNDKKQLDIKTSNLICENAA